MYTKKLLHFTSRQPGPGDRGYAASHSGRSNRRHFDAAQQECGSFN
jgi:hypothetical protein